MKRSDKATRRRGFALILVTAHVILLFSFWNIANRQTGHLLKLEETLNRRDSRDRGSLAASASALSLLETGTPPYSPFGGVSTQIVNGTSIDYLVTITDLGEGRWQIEATPADPNERADPLPTTFAPEP